VAGAATAALAATFLVFLTRTFFTLAVVFVVALAEVFPAVASVEVPAETVLPVAALAEAATSAAKTKLEVEATNKAAKAIANNFFMMIFLFNVGGSKAYYVLPCL
jgi:hypothetical protein